MSVGSTKRSQSIMIDRDRRAPYMGEVVDWRSFFRCYIGQTHRLRPALESHIFYINRVVRAKFVPLSFSSLSLPLRELVAKNPSFWKGNGDFLLKSLRAYLGTEDIDHND